MPHPILLEINTRCWLQSLSSRDHRITLGTVPDSFFKDWQQRGFTHVWLMGVWTNGERSRQVSLSSVALRAEYTAALPDWTEKDVTGSPYAIAAYQVPRNHGGEAGLKKFRQQLHRHGMKLILDFVPNHTGLDHPWLSVHPERYVQGDSPESASFIGGSAEFPVRLCHGRDPYFDPWRDTAQLDYRRPDTRAAMAEELTAVAARCDGVRCDMAMLLLNEIFHQTWQNQPCRVEPAADEFWPAAISRVRKQFPEFLFLAEAYWDREAELIGQGFDFAYHKAFADAAIERPEQLATVVHQGDAWLQHAARFLENHDEPRVAARLDREQHRAAALAMLGLPGMRFLNEGQTEGWRIKTPVHLGRRASEPTDPVVHTLYDNLLETLNHAGIGTGRSEVLTPRPAWDGNDSNRCLLLVQWQQEEEVFHLVVVNAAPHPSQGYAAISIGSLAAHNWSMSDLLGTERHVRAGESMHQSGLYLDIPAFGAQLFEFRHTTEQPT